MNSVLGKGRHTTETQRRAVFDRKFDTVDEPLRQLLGKTESAAYRVTDNDFAPLATDREGNQDSLFELIVSTAIGAADRSLRTGLAAIEQADRGATQAGDSVASKGVS